MTTSAAPGRATSDTPKTRRVGRLAAALVLLVVAMASSGLLSARAADTSNGLDVVGTMPLGFTTFAAIPAMFVDAGLQTGIEQGTNQQGAAVLQTYDLTTLRPKAVIQFPTAFNNSTVGSGIAAAVDEPHHRMFWLPDLPGTPSCTPSPIFVLDLKGASWRNGQVACYVDPTTGLSSAFGVDGVSYYAPADKLYVTGLPASDPAAAGLLKNFAPKEATIVRELDPDTMEVKWEVDAGSFCDWHRVTGTGDYGGLVTRVGNDVILYCHKGGGHGGAGEIVDIPLDDQGKPKTNSIKSMVAVTAHDVRFDPVTGRLLIVAPGPPYGPAVWVYDAIAQRFLGVVPTGVEGSFLAGFDGSSGRLYLHDSRGFVLVDARHDPIPGGVRYDTLAEPVGVSAAGYPAMAVDQATHRLIFADYPPGPPNSPSPPPTQYQVVKDDVPSIVDVCTGKPKPCPDPDAGTEDIPEEPGKTGHTFSSGANAFGVHLLNTGGIPADIQNLPGDTRGNGFNEGAFDCYIPSPAPCLSTALVSSGDREGFLAQTSLAQGSALGSTGYATAGRVGPNDHATDADIREAGNCGADRLGSLFGNDDLRNGVQTLCQNDSMPAPIKDALAEMRQGTQRKDSEYPINGSLCVDFGGTSADKESHDPSPQMGYSKVHCDATAPRTTTDAEFAVVGQPKVPDPNTLAIAHSTSHAESELTDKGAVTNVNALAEGINIGGQITIGRIATSAETRTHGRTGTAYTHVTRTISDVQGPGIDCAAVCDPKKVADTINQLFAPNLVAIASDAAQVATPKGFTASVGKDPSHQAADSLINDDDTLTFDGLDLLVVNDQPFNKQNPIGTNGQTPSGNRSRFLIGLAGVQAESHYGIFKLPPPDSGGGGGTEPTPPSPGTPDIPPTPGQDIFTPGTPGTASYQPGTLGYHLAGSVGTPPQHKKPGLVSQLLHGIFHPLEGLKNFWALIINHPAEAVMVFLMLALLGTPVYLALRRREMTRALMGEA